MAEKSAMMIWRDAKSPSYIDAAKTLAKSSRGWNLSALITLKNYDRASEYLKNEESEYKKEGLQNYLSSIYGDMAAIEVHRADYAKAIFYYNLSIQNALAYRSNLNCMQAFTSLAWDIYFLKFGDSRKALENLRKALWYFQTNPARQIVDSFEALNVFAAMANIYVEQKMFDSAWVYFQQAFDQIRPGMTEAKILAESTEELQAYRKIYYLASLIIDKGDAYRKMYQLSRQSKHIREALRIYRLADQFLEKIKMQQTDLLSKLFWRKDSRRLYEHAIDASAIQGDPASAFYFFERSRAILLNDQMNAQRWLSDREFERQALHTRKILNLMTRLSSLDSNSKEFAETQNEIFDLKQQIKPIRNIDPVQISLNDVQKFLSTDGQSMMELFEGDSAVYTLLVLPGQSFLQQLDKKDYDQTVNRFLFLISKRSMSGVEFAEYIKTAYHLYDLLFHKYPLNQQRIIISPDGPYFPFEALCTNPDLTLPKYFVLDHAVSYAYSARFLANEFPKSTIGSKQAFLGFAPLQFSSQVSLASLPESDHSLEQIGNHFENAEVLTGSKATKSNFLEQFARFGILQLYTHAADSSERGEPVIYFADSSLYLSELIPEIKPVSRLIVLSACETGSGKLFKGEGVFSFNRAFASLGIPATLTNLWGIENKSMYQQTELFYKYLIMGLPADVALQKAKIEFIKKSSKEKTLPYFWAATILAGKAERVVEKKNHGLTWLILLLSATIIGSTAFYLINNEKFILRRRSNEVN
jgi:CHAT domain-containing protein